jgi:hypothetical protein
MMAAICVDDECVQILILANAGEQNERIFFRGGGIGTLLK